MAEIYGPANPRLLAGAYVDGIRAQPNARDGVSRNASVDRVARGGAAAFIVYSAGIGLAYCSQLVVARVVGVDTFGLYTYVFAWMVVLAYFSALGFDVALLRFIPAYQTERAWPLLRGVIQYAQRRALAVGILVVLIGVCIVLASGSPPERRNTFIVGFLLVPILALLRIRCAIVRALGGVVSSLAPDRLVREGMLIGLVAIAALGLGWTVDAPLVMSAVLVGAALGLGCTVLALRRRLPTAISDVVPQYDPGVWIRTAIPLVIMAATDVLMNRIGVILLGWIADTKDAGVYGLAFNIALVVTLPQVALNTLFAPEISSLYARKDMATLQVIVTKATRWMFFAGLCIGIVLFVLAEPLLAWFGTGFDAGASALRILLVGQVIVAGAGSQLYVMTMTGHERSAAILLVCSAVANGVASFVLIAHFGLTGAAIAAAAILIVWNAAMAIFLRRRLGLLPGAFAFATCWRRADDRTGV